jgi:hypothetical protein
MSCTDVKFASVQSGWPGCPVLWGASYCAPISCTRAYPQHIFPSCTCTHGQYGSLSEPTPPHSCESTLMPVSIPAFQVCNFLFAYAPVFLRFHHFWTIVTSERNRCLGTVSEVLLPLRAPLKKDGHPELVKIVVVWSSVCAKRIVRARASVSHKLAWTWAQNVVCCMTTRRDENTFLCWSLIIHLFILCFRWDRIARNRLQIDAYRKC